MIETQNELTSKKKGKLQEGMLEYFPENQASKRAGICQLQEPSTYKPKIPAGLSHLCFILIFA